MSLEYDTFYTIPQVDSCLRHSTIDVSHIGGEQINMNHHGILSGRRLDDVQYHSSWGFLYLSIEGARPIYRKYRSY